MASVVETQTSGKRKRSDEQNDEPDTHDSQENEIPNSSRGSIPYDISDWNEEHIQSLSFVVQYEENATPSDLLANYRLRLNTDKHSFLHKFIDEFEEFFIQSCHFNGVLNEAFDSLTRHLADLLRDSMYFSTQIFLKANFQTPKDAPEEVIKWCQRFKDAGVQFAERLYFTVLKRDLDITRDNDGNKKDPLTDYDFQFLFEAFTSIFDLRSFWYTPLLSIRTISFSSGRKVAGKADILYCQDVGKNVEIPFCNMKNVVAICEVTKYNEEPRQHDWYPAVAQQHETQRLSSSSTHRRLPPHMSSTELGQLGGKLLLYSQQSVVKDVIFGFFVQETKVSFAALKITRAEYDGIMTGKHGKTNPTLVITRPFDYMKKKDRQYLIRPLLELSMLQQKTFVL